MKSIILEGLGKDWQMNIIAIEITAIEIEIHE